MRRRSHDWNPYHSTKTRLVEVRPDGARIYAHTVSWIAGKFLVVWGENDWAAVESLEEARGCVGP